MIKKYKHVLRFLCLFLGTYTLLSFAYHYYLDWSEGQEYFPDYITQVVTDQSEKIICKMGYPVNVKPHDDMPGLKLIIHKRHVASVVEGCNAVSVMILFLSFVISFFQGIKKTLTFAVVGVAVIYVMNIFRIAILTILYFRFPEYQEIMHSLVFPSIIYGTVFLLWMYWVKQFKLSIHE